jgi:hypothetical protein
MTGGVVLSAKKRGSARCWAGLVSLGRARASARASRWAARVARPS